MIIGLMGVGKSTLGRELAAALSLDYTDSDDDIERLFGASGAVAVSYTHLTLPTILRV